MSAQERLRAGVLSTGEAITVAGMSLGICSLFLGWAVSPQPATQLPLPILFRDAEPMKPLIVSGFHCTVRWPLTLCSILAGSTVMWNSNSKSWIPLSAVQVSCGIACVVIALTHAALLPGVVVGLLGGCLVLVGAYIRFRKFLQPDCAR